MGSVSLQKAAEPLWFGDEPGHTRKGLSCYWGDVGEYAYEKQVPKFTRHGWVGNSVVWSIPRVIWQYKKKLPDTSNLKKEGFWVEVRGCGPQSRKSGRQECEAVDYFVSTVRKQRAHSTDPQLLFLCLPGPSLWYGATHHQGGSSHPT